MQFKPSLYTNRSVETYLIHPSPFSGVDTQWKRFTNSDHKQYTLGVKIFTGLFGALADLRVVTWCLGADLNNSGDLFSVSSTLKGVGGLRFGVSTLALTFNAWFCDIVGDFDFLPLPTDDLLTRASEPEKMQNYVKLLYIYTHLEFILIFI